MNGKYDNTDRYYIFVSEKILNLAPVTGAGAACIFSAAWFLGHYPDVSLFALLCFDFICLSYFAVAYFLRKRGIVVNGAVSQKAMAQVELILGALILLQWNLITYIFPTRAFWGYAPMFVLLTAFFFHKRVVRDEIIGISLSIILSWFIKGDKLLPVRDESFYENLSLRIVALVISFTVIYVLTYFAERFTMTVKQNHREMEKQNDELRNMGKDIIDFTADIIEERDATSGSHVKRLKAYTRILAEEVAKECPEYKLTPEKIDRITLACVLHDVGKIAIPDSILQKPGRLTPEEFDIIKTHTSIGARVIDKLPDSVGKDYKHCCREICQFHHEKYDGKGYPMGIKGDDIPISAQIVSVVDCYDALASDRPYKAALPGDVAINMILNGECGVFSDKMKKCLEACRDRLVSE